MMVMMLAITTVQTCTLFLYHPDTRSIESLNHPSSFSSTFSTESQPFIRRACSDFFTSLSGNAQMDALICASLCSAVPVIAWPLAKMSSRVSANVFEGTYDGCLPGLLKDLISGWP